MSRIGNSHIPGGTLHSPDPKMATGTQNLMATIRPFDGPQTPSSRLPWQPLMSKMPAISNHRMYLARDPFLGYVEDKDDHPSLDSHAGHYEPSDQAGYEPFVVAPLPSIAPNSRSSRCMSPIPDNLCHADLSLESLWQRHMAFEQLVRQHMSRLESAVASMIQTPPTGDPLIIKHAATVQEIKKQHLDDHCLPLFLENPEPIPSQLQDLAKSFHQAVYPGNDRRLITSVVRRWFRKKREEVGLKLAAGLRRMYGSEELAAVRDHVIEEMEHGTFNWHQLFEISKLEMPESEHARRFCVDKALNYLRKVKPHRPTV